MSSNLKYYTSMAAVENSVAAIEKALVEARATNISKSYDGFGNVDSVSFRMIVKELPVFVEIRPRIDAVLKVLTKGSRRPPTEALQKQARRTAWKIQSEWVALQLTMIKLEQAELAELFLGKIFNPATGETMWRRIEERGLPNLLQ